MLRAEISYLRMELDSLRNERRSTPVVSRAVSSGIENPTITNGDPPYFIGRIIGKTQKTPGNPTSLQAYSVRLLDPQSVYSNVANVEALFTEKYPPVEASYKSLSPPAGLNNITYLQPAFEISDNPNVPVDGTVVVQIWRAYQTGHFFFKYDPSNLAFIFAKITGSQFDGLNNVWQHSWTKQNPTLIGGWTDDTTSAGVIAGTIFPSVAYPAIALDGDVEMTDRIVMLWRGAGGMPRADFELIKRGSSTQPQQHRLTLNNVLNGTFTLTISGKTTSAIAYNASSSAIATAINALAPTPAFAQTATVTGTMPGPMTIQLDTNFRNVTINTNSLIGDLDFRFARRPGFWAEILCKSFHPGTETWRYKWREVENASKYALPTAKSGGRSGYPTIGYYLRVLHPGDVDTPAKQLIKFCGPTITSGTYTIGGSAGIAYNADAATVQTAIRAAITDLVIVTGTFADGFTIEWPSNGAESDLAVDVSGLSPQTDSFPAMEQNNAFVSDGTIVWMEYGYNNLSVRFLKPLTDCTFEGVQNFYEYPDGSKNVLTLDTNGCLKAVRGKLC